MIPIATLDLSGHYAYFHGTEAITHTSTRDTGNLTDAVANALRRQVTSKEAAASNGVYTTSDLAWSLPVSQAAYTPKPGDKITDAAAVVWTVLQVDKATLGTRWRCLSRDMVLANDLRDAVVIFAPDNSQDNAKSRTTTFVQLTAELAARVQPVAGAPVVDLGKRMTVTSWNVWLAEDVENVTHECQVRDQDGNVYQITGWQNKARIDDLMLITCEVLP